MTPFEIRPSCSVPAVKHCVKLRTQRGYREEHQAVILTGADLVEELPPTVEMLTLFFIKDEDSSLAQPSTRRIAVSTAVMAKITGLETVAPTTLAAEVILPEPVDLRKWAGPPLQRLLVLERCQDPGNLVRRAFPRVIQAAVKCLWVIRVIRQLMSLDFLVRRPQLALPDPPLNVSQPFLLSFAGNLAENGSGSGLGCRLPAPWMRGPIQ